MADEKKTETAPRKKNAVTYTGLEKNTKYIVATSSGMVELVTDENGTYEATSTNAQEVEALAQLGAKRKGKS